MVKNIFSRVFYPLGALILSALWLVLLYFRLPRLIWHSGILMAYFTDQGLVMYKDFLNFYLPLSTYFVLPFFKISNWNLEVEPLLSLTIALITLVVIFKTATQFLSPLATSLSIIFFTLLFYYFTTAIQYTGEAITGLFIILAVNRVLNFLKFGAKKIDIFIIGILISTTLLFNQISALVLVAFTVFLLISIFRKSGKNLLFNLGPTFIAALILPIAFVSFYFIQQNAFFDFVNNNFIYYLNYVKLAKGSGSLLNLPWNEIILFYMPVIVGIYLLTTLRTIPTTLRPILLLLLSASIVTIPSIIFSVFHRHHFLYALPILALLFGLVFEVGIKASKNSTKIILLLAGIFLLYQISTLILPWYYQRITTGKNHSISNDILPGDSMFDAVNWVKENTGNEDRLLVAGDGLFYYKADRLPSVKFFTVLPWHYKPLSQSAPIIEKNKPDYWVISPSYLKRISSPEGWNSPEITEFIYIQLKSCYKKKVAFPDWEIWQKSCS